MKNIILFTSTYFFSLIIDYIWLGLIAKKIYSDAIGTLLKKQGSEIAFNIPSALIVYAILSFGIIYFALPKSDNSYTGALITGLFFGLVTYGIYNFTNLAILQNWNLKIALIDLCWGMCLCMMTTCFALFIRKLL
jgi:uncharacterized membrane protein